MALRFVTFSLLVIIAFAHARDISNAPRTAIEKTNVEGRTLEIPIIGTFLLLVFKISGFVVSSALSLLEYKLTALSFVSNMVSAIFQNYLPVIMGTAVVVGLCLVTNVFSSDPVYEIDHTLIQAARSLDQGIVKYRLI